MSGSLGRGEMVAHRSFQESLATTLRGKNFLEADWFPQLSENEPAKVLPQGGTSDRARSAASAWDKVGQLPRLASGCRSIAAFRARSSKLV